MSQEDDVMQQLNINKILMSVLGTVGEVKIPMSSFLDITNDDKVLVVEYDEVGSSLIFKLKDK